MKNAIVLCSGGIDSVTTAHLISKNYKNVKILFFDYGQKTRKREERCSRECAKNINAEFIKVKLGFIARISESLINKPGKANKISKKQLKDTRKESGRYYVPCRNTIFLAYALALGESLYLKGRKIYDIFTGFKCEGREAYPDTTKEFVSEINRLARFTNFKGKIIAPLIEKDKEDIISLGTKLGIDYNKTYSCYVGTRKQCGKCLACMLRKQGFYWANIKDPTGYSE